VIITVFLAIFLVGCCVFVYGLAIKGVDRYEPEPWWLLIVCFFWGALGATFGALVLNTIGGEVVIGVMGPSQVAQGATASFIAPPVEESMKGSFMLVVWAASAVYLKELDGALDGAIYGGVIGLGFTLTEDVLYITRGSEAGGMAAFTAIFFLRTILGGLGHASFTAMTGLGVGVACESRSIAVKVIAPIGGWMSAMGLHFLHNFLVSFLGAFGLFLKLGVFFTFDILFFIVLYVLAFRDRSIIVRNLVDEVGVMLHPKEFKTMTSGAQLVPLWNLMTLWSSPRGYFPARKKQLALAEIAFLKHRRRRGEGGSTIDNKEREARATVQSLNDQGVFIGKM
jgi:RsiW-degrading membrane proteinase PrsW (M82 family)